MNVNRSWSWSIASVAVVALAMVPVLYASGLLDRDARRLERAREAHAQEVERALDIYTTRVQRANETLERVYGQLIARYEQRGEHGVAEELRRELEELTTDAFVIGADLEEQAGKDGGYEQLIESIGPVLIDANGRTVASGALQEANYVVLFFSAQWCGPCRRFTPELVEFHQRYSQRHRIAVIYVSSDRSEDQMMQYLQSRDMPFHAVPYHRVDASGLKRQYNARGGIPNMVVLDREEQIVLRSTYPGMPPPQVLQALADRL